MCLQGGYFTKLMVEVMVVPVMLVLLLVGSPLSKYDYMGGYLTKLMVGMMVGLLVVATKT